MRFYLLFLCFLIALSTPALAGYDPAAGESFDAATGSARTARDTARGLAVTGLVRGLSPSSLEACSLPERAGSDCDRIDLGPCRRSIVELYGLIEPVDDAPAAHALADIARSSLVDAAARLGLAQEAALEGRCDAIVAPGSRAVKIGIDFDGQVLRVRPLVPLRAGRKYQLRIKGLDREMLAASTVVPQSDGGEGAISIRPGTLGDSFLDGYQGAPSSFDSERALEVVTGIDRDLESLEAFGGLASVQISLPKPLGAEDLERLRIHYSPFDPEALDSLLQVRVLDPREPLLAYRTLLTDRKCAPLELHAERQEGWLGLPFGGKNASVGHVLAGNYPSLEVPATQSAVATEQRRPFFLALPNEWKGSTPLVLLLSGHRGHARSMLTDHAPGLAQRGLAAASVDLPEHGERDTTPADFVDLFRPRAIGQNMVQAATDVVAFVEAALTCGFRLHDGQVYRPETVRFLGYSLGGMVGAITRAVEPRLGASVILAPGGGIDQWLLLQVSYRLGMSFFLCSGGPEGGESCDGTGRCAAPGRCVVNPFNARLAAQLSPAYQWLLSTAEPAAFAAQRVGKSVSHAPLLLVAGGTDLVLNPGLAGLLADAYGMRVLGPGHRRGPNADFVQWPDLDHALVQDPGVRAQAYDFLASDGRRGRSPPSPK